LKPTIILKAEEFIAEWFKKVRGIPEDILFGRSHNEWTDEKMAMEYLGRNFGEDSITAQKAGDEYRLLLFEGHSSHVNIKFLDYCISQNIIPYCLPPHTTHRLQPLDVCIFSSYKHQYQKELTRRSERHEHGVSKENFYEILMIARRASFTRSNIQSGFRNTGLVPVDRTIILSKIQALPPKSPIICPNSTIPTQSDTNPPLPDLEPLSAFSTQQIDKLYVPQNRVEIERQELIALATLPTNDPIEWGLKKIVSNLSIAANRGLTEIEEKERQIKNLKQQLADIQHKRAANRTKIPTSGKAWIDRNDITRFFETQSTEERKSTQKKYHHATGLVAIRSKKLAECIEKRKETERLEEEGRLPKRRKTSSILREEESHLTRQISEAQQKVDKFQKHLQDLAFDVGMESDEFLRSPEVESCNNPTLVWLFMQQVTNYLRGFY